MKASYANMDQNCNDSRDTIKGRKMNSTMDPFLSTISGNGTQNFEAFDTVHILVQAKDSSGNNIITGGDIIMVHISNQCERSNDQFGCFDVSNQQKVMESNIYDQMIDNNDGTYTYDYTVNLNGTVSVYATLLQRGVHGEYFGNIQWSGSPDHSNLTDQINFDFGLSSIYGLLHLENVCAR